MTRRAQGMLGSAIALIILALPLFSYAKSDLRSTIYAELKRTQAADVSDADIAAMAELLARDAEAENIAAQDIAPESNTNISIPNTYCTSPSLLCNSNRAFGFAGEDHWIPLVLALLSALLILIMIAYRDHHHADLGVHPMY